VISLKQTCDICGIQKPYVEQFNAFPCNIHAICSNCVRPCYAKRSCLPCSRKLTVEEVRSLGRKALRCVRCRAAIRFDPNPKCQCLCAKCSSQGSCQECGD
jgi:hypothetical protein